MLHQAQEVRVVRGHPFFEAAHRAEEHPVVERDVVSGADPLGGIMGLGARLQPFDALLGLRRVFVEQAGSGVAEQGRQGEFQRCFDDVRRERRDVDFDRAAWNGKSQLATSPDMVFYHDVLSPEKARSTMPRAQKTSSSLL